jgi:DNA helicase-2/ATP-dependent DNA helicase PcrA
MDLLSDLNEPQAQAVSHVDGPLLVLAGAGSGKTRVITRRCAYLIRQGVAPWSVLAITFTNKAAQEMRQRVEQLGGTRGATVATFHALCARLLREFAAEAGLQPQFTIYDRDDQLKIAKQAVAALDYPTDRFAPAKVLGAISAAKNELQDPHALAQLATGPYERGIAAIYAKYNQLLAHNSALDFDDLLMRVACLLKSRPDVRQQLGRRYRYVMIDEYQDTNHAQYVIAHGIAMDHGNICATGDPDQSIYAWRGADINNILDFEKDYPNTKVVRLEENYRSTAAILSAASQLISHNKLRKEKALWTRQEGGPAVKVVYCDHEHAEANLVARRIAAYRAGGGQLDDVAVFYRVNSLSRIMEEAMFRQGIAYRIARGLEFYNRKEIKDVLAYLKVLVNPGDDLSLKRVINTPPRGIGDTTVGRLEQLAAARNVSLAQACRIADQAGLSSAAATRVAGFIKMIDTLAANLDRPAKEVMENVVKASGMERALEGKEEEQLQARANVDELISSAAEFDSIAQIAEDSTSLAEYVYQISLVSDIDHFEGSSGAVTLMTLHAAKGLEFPVVFVIGCETGLLPFQREGDAGWDQASTNAKLEEERRLAFVGMTRAKRELTLTTARRRRIRGQEQLQAASQFLGELGNEFVVAEDFCTGTGGDAGLGYQKFPRNTSRSGFYSDVTDRRQIETMNNPLGSSPEDSQINDDPFAGLGRDSDETPLPAEYEQLKVGSRVASPKFGQGKIVSISQPWPLTRVKVAFAQYGQKTLVLAMARLEVL